MTSPECERCWVIHKRKPYWTICPQCGAPVRWVRLWDGTWSPCDEEPVLYSFPGGKTKYKIIAKRDVVLNAVPRPKAGDKPRYGRIPHYYTCPVLREERRAWAIENS